MQPLQSFWLGKKERYRCQFFLCPSTMVANHAVQARVRGLRSSITRTALLMGALASRGLPHPHSGSSARVEINGGTSGAGSTSVQSECGTATFGAHNLSGLQMEGQDWPLPTNTTLEGCLAACCAMPNCTAWNLHLASTDPSHHAHQCWLTSAAAIKATPGRAMDTWVGGSRVPVQCPGNRCSKVNITEVNSAQFLKAPLLPNSTKRCVGVTGASKFVSVALALRCGRWIGPPLE